MRLTIYDEERLYSESLAILFRRRDHEVVACPSTPEELTLTVLQQSPDACLASVDTDPTGVQVIRDLRTLSPTIAIVALGGAADLASLLHTLEAGADGVCLKLDGIAEIETILQRCIRSRRESHQPREAAWSHTATAAARHKAPPDRSPMLTPKERLVLDLLIKGASTSKIAAELSVAEATIRTHFQHLFAKFGVHSRLALVAAAVRTDSVRLGESRAPGAYPSSETA